MEIEFALDFQRFFNGISKNLQRVFNLLFGGSVVDWKGRKRTSGWCGVFFSFGGYQRPNHHSVPYAIRPSRVIRPGCLPQTRGPPRCSQKQLPPEKRIFWIYVV